MTGVDRAVERIGEAKELASRSGAALEKSWPPNWTGAFTSTPATRSTPFDIATASDGGPVASEEINQSIVQVNDMSRQTAEAMGDAQIMSSWPRQAQGSQP